jgi:hypothetical protein
MTVSAAAAVNFGRNFSVVKVLALRGKRTLVYGIKLVGSFKRVSISVNMRHLLKIL